MKINADLMDLLLRSLDPGLTIAEAERLRSALAQSGELRAEREKLQYLRRRIGELRVEAEPAFVDRVMDRIHRSGRPALDALVASLLPRVAAACLIVFLISLLIVYFSTGAISLDALIGVQEITPEDAGLYLSGR